MRPLALFLLTSTLAAQPTLCTQLKSLTAPSPAHWGISITTLEGAPLCTLNAAQLFRPASNAKLFTTLTALALFGPDQTFSTSVTLDPHGNLILHGDGDAFLSTRPMPYTPASQTHANARKPTNPLETLADQVAATGIHHITGDILGDDTVWPSEPYPSDWAVDDLLWGYGAPVSALTVDDNKLALTVSPGASPGDLPTAAVFPLTSFYQFDIQASTAAAGKPTAIRLEKDPGSHLIHLYGQVALGTTYTDDLALDDPAQYAAETFKSLLEARGIVIDGTAHARHRPPTATDTLEQQLTLPLKLPPAPHTPIPYPGSAAATSLATHTSPPLLDDITVTLKVSQNLHAELLLHLLGQRFAADGSTAQGLRVVHQFLLRAGLPKDDVFLFDGSGLSGHDLVTPRALTQLLVFAACQPWFESFKAALPIGGVDGSLASRFNGPLKNRVFAKTGTLGESRALSGYLTAASGRTLVFSILVDNHPPNSTADRTLTDHLLELIAAAN